MKQALIKVCGMRQADNIREAEALGIDWMGLIFWPKTPRYVAQPPGYLPKKAKRVGVFVDADLTDITSHVVDYRLDFIQLHGKETPDYIDNLRLLLNGQNSVAPGIIKAFSIADADDLRKTEGYEGKADYYLFDTKGKAVGGNGEKFDWQVLSHYESSTPFLLSGGIGPEDAQRLKGFSHPRCIGIDLNSRFELAPGLKDIELLKRFIQTYKNP